MISGKASCVSAYVRNLLYNVLHLNLIREGISKTYIREGGG